MKTKNGALKITSIKLTDRLTLLLKFLNPSNWIGSP